jgi:hypothetical protein
LRRRASWIFSQRPLGRQRWNWEETVPHGGKNHHAAVAATGSKGDHAFCLARDCDVVVTSWTDARISWPRCRSLGTRGGGSGILVDDELARAIRHESAAAIRYWWGVNVSTMAWWRRALGVGWTDSPGSRRLRQAASDAGALALKLNGLPDAVCDRMSERAKRLNLISFAQAKPARPSWTQAELGLLGKMPDATVAKRIGRTESAVRVKRSMLGILSAQDRRRREFAKFRAKC